MVKKYKTPFTQTLFQKTIDDVIVPPDLAEYIALGANVARYRFSEGHYNYIFQDSVDEHTKRMVLYAENLPIPNHDKADLVRMLWIHDIPEILDSQEAQSDMTSTDKLRYPELAFAGLQREQAIVDRIFSPYDRALYEAFEPAKDMLFTGKIDFEATTPVGLLARILDNFIDGINSFHGFMTDYLTGDFYDSSRPFPQKDAFDYCFQKGPIVYRHVSQIDHPDYQSLRATMLDILENDFFGFVRSVWTPIALSRMPVYAQEESQKFFNIPYSFHKK